MSLHAPSRTSTRLSRQLRLLTPLVLLGVLAFLASACSPPVVSSSSVGMSAAVQASQ